MNGFLITLAGSMDDMPVAFFATAKECDQFMEANPPHPVDGKGCETTGPLADACNVFGRGPSLVFGYNVTKFVGGKPVKVYMDYWLDGDWPTRAELAAMPDAERAEFWHDLRYSTIK